MRVPTRLRTHTRKHIGGAAAHNGPRRIEHPAERVPPAVALRPGRKGSAYRKQRGDTRGVPRADVRVERRRRLERLRAEPRTQHTGACVRLARIGDPFICVASRAWIWLHACIGNTYTVYVRVPSMDGLTKRARRTRTHAAH